MTVFNSIKVVSFTLLFAANNLVATAKSPSIERVNAPIKGIEKDSVEGVIQDFTRLYDKNFAVNKNTIVVLSNKYGAIDVHTNNGSTVIVKVKVTVNATSQAQADKVLERINIIFNDGPDFVKTETMVENQPKPTVIFAGTAPTTNCDFRIDYDVTMPAGNRLDLTNRHGNTTIAALKTAVKIDQKYGDVRLDGATSATLVLAYGGGQLSELNTLYGTVSYGKLTSPNIRNAYLKTIYSQLRFDQIGAMEIQSNYDTYDINDITTLKATCKYGAINVRNIENLTLNGNNTGFKAQKIENNADMDCQYGTVRIGNVKNNFGNINIKGYGTNCIILVDPSVSYQLDMNGTFSNMNQPASLRPVVNRQDATHWEVMGTVGNNLNTKSVIRVRMTRGEFKIK